MNVTEQINNFVALNGGNERDALNVALARLDAPEARAADLLEHNRELSETITTLTAERDEAISMRDKVIKECEQAVDGRDELRRQLEQAQGALQPFAHIDLIKKLAGNEQGDESIVYQRNDAVLTLGDFRRAYRLLNPVVMP